MIPKHLKIKSSSPFLQKQKNERKTKMSHILEKIKKVDQHLSRSVAQYRAKHKKSPTELELMQDSTAVPLITQRKRLVKQYEFLKQEALYAEKTYKTIKDDPVSNAQKSFRSIKTSNPFSGNKEYSDPITVPALSPIKRIGHNTNKQGTLWDPRFNFGDVTVDPRIERYYKRLSRGY